MACWLACGSVLANEPPISGLVFAPDGQHLVAISQAGLRTFHWPDLEPQKSAACAASNLHALAFSPDRNRLAIAGGDPGEQGSVEVFSWPELRSMQLLTGHQDSATAVVWLNREEVVSSGLDHQLLRWRLEESGSPQVLLGHSRGVTTLCLVPGLLVSGSIDQNLRVWDLESWQQVRSLNNHTQTIHVARARPGDRPLPMIASISDDRSVRFWQPGIGRMVRFVRLESRPLDAAWLPDGSAIAVSCVDGSALLINPDTAEIVERLSGLTEWAYSLAVHPNGRELGLGGRRGEIIQIDLPKN